MRRFDKLRWVPMLIQAFYDARLKMTTTHQPLNQEQEAIDMVVETTGKKPMTAKPQSDLRMEAESRSGKRKNRKVPTPMKPAAKGKNEVTAQLLRELRATKQQLKGLDEIRQQLNGLSSSLNDFNGRINDLQARAERTSSEVSEENTDKTTSQSTAPTHHSPM